MFQDLLPIFLVVTDFKEAIPISCQLFLSQVSRGSQSHQLNSTVDQLVFSAVFFGDVKQGGLALNDIPKKTASKDAKQLILQ